MSIDLTKVEFYSGVNYLKHSSFCGSTSITLVNGGTATYTVNHGLGYIPFYQVLCDVDGDGTIWGATKIDLNTESETGAITTITPSATIDTSNLVISLYSPSTSGSRTVYWVVYLDYGND